jgi:hypothetical protein
MEATNKKGNVSSATAVEEIKKDSTQEEKVDNEKSTSKIKDLQDVEFEEGEEKKLLKQIASEHKFATRELDTWVDKNLERLKLYNNQMRGDQYVGEPLLFTHMNTWLASLYDDKHDKQWIPAEEGDIKTVENLDSLTQFDYDLMGMDEIKYFMYWDSLFFSYGIVDMLEFDTDKKCPAPTVIDPLVFYYDTLASSIDGNVRNKGGMRFLGWRLNMSEKDVKESGMLYDDALEILKKANRDDGMSSTDEARQKRIEAIGGTYEHISDDSMGDNNLYEVVQHRTHWKGDKVVIILTEDLSNILGAKILPTENEKSISWFVTANRFNPQPNQFKGVSLPDLLEDKQRKKAVLANDVLRLTRTHVYGSYAYDENKVKNVADLKWGYDKYIPVNGSPSDVITPIRKDSPDSNLLNNMLNYLDTSAQTASATPSLQQGVLSEQQRTLGELEMVASSSKTRYSLALKTFAMGERDFWQLYYVSLKVFFKEGIGEKVVRIAGSPNNFKGLTRSDIICKVDPDVRIGSKTLEEAKRMRKFNMYSQLLSLLLQDPEADKRASVKHGLDLSGMERDMQDVVLPPTRDELIARDQNLLLSKNEKAPFMANDNHLVHIRVHKEARETKAKQAHIKLHLKALMEIQKNPELDMQDLGMQQGEESGVSPATMQGAVSQATGSRPMSPAQEAGMNNI